MWDLLILSCASWVGFYFLPASEEVPERVSHRQYSVGISSSYTEDSYTNEQLVNALLDVSDFCTKLMNRFFGDEKLSSLGSMVQTVEGLVLLGGMTAYHEIGHALRWKAMGGDYILFRTAGGAGDCGQNFFKYLFIKMVLPGGGGSTRLKESWRVCYKNLKINVILSAGGLNNEVYFAERLTEQFYKNEEANIPERVLSLFEKRALSNYWSAVDESNTEKDKKNKDAGIYSSFDPVGILASYQRLRLPVTKKDMVRTGVIATWLSGTTYSHIIALWNFAWDKHLYCAKPLEFFGFAVQDTFPYLTTKGISYKVISGYRLNEKIRILFGFEHVFVGIPGTEYMLGIRHQLGEVYLNVSYKVVTVFGKQGINLESSCSIPIGSFSFTAGFNTYASQSLLGEHHSMDLRKKQSHTGYVSVAYVY